MFVIHIMITFYRLSGCHITEEGCASLGSALKSNPSLLRDLDLSNSDLKDAGIKMLSAVLQDPLCKLEKLRSVFMFYMRQ